MLVGVGLDLLGVQAEVAGPGSEPVEHRGGFLVLAGEGQALGQPSGCRSARGERRS